MLIRVIVVAACGAVGFFAASAFNTSSVAVDAPRTTEARAPAPVVELKMPTAAESAFIGEWEQLRATHGDDNAALYAAIKDTKDAFRRRAFRSALIAEWSVTNPQAALAYLLEKDSGNAGQLAREWLRRDPQGAINGLLAGGEKALGMMRGLLGEIAKVAPARLVEVLGLIKPPGNRWDRSADDSFAIFAAKDPTAARAAAESITGEQRGQALAGVARAWAEKDGVAALAWAQAMPAGEARDEALRAVLAGWAKTDPIAALDKLDLAPPGGDDMQHASDAGAQVLREAAKKDWDGTIAWLRDHPGKLGRASLDGLQGEMSRRLGVDTPGTMRLFTTGALPGLEQVFGNAVLNEGYLHRDAILNWLDAQPPGDLTSSLRGSLVSAMAWKEPEVALAFLDKLPDTPENAALIERGVMSLINGGSRMDQFEDLLENAPSKLRLRLIETGFSYGARNVTGDPSRWIARLDEIPVERRASATAQFASGWAATDPQAAAEWSNSISDTAARDSALIQIAIQWSSDDSREAAGWVNSLPRGTGRDNAALGLVSTLRDSQPENAWTWAVSVESPELREISLARAYKALQGKDPAVAEQLLTSSALPEAEIKTLRDWFQSGAKPK